MNGLRLLTNFIDLITLANDTIIVWSILNSLCVFKQNTITRVAVGGGRLHSRSPSPMKRRWNIGISYPYPLELWREKAVHMRVAWLLYIRVIDKHSLLSTWK